MSDTYSQRLKTNTEVIREVFIVLIFLGSFGIPGNASIIVGKAVGVYFEYFCFFLQLYLIIISSGDNFFNIRIINLKKKYWPIYVMLLVFFADSLIVTHDIRLQLITCIRFTTTAVFALWIIEHLSMEYLISVLTKTVYIYFFITVLFSILYPSDAYSFSEGGFRGLVITKNNAAILYVVCIMVLLLKIKLELHSNRLPSRLLLGVLIGELFLCILCNSLGAIIILTMIMLVIIFFKDWDSKHKRLSIGFLYVIISVGFIIFSLSFLQIFEPVLSTFGKDATLSGRVPLWRRIIHIMQQSHTLGGYGLGMFWRNQMGVDLLHAGFEEYSFLGKMTSGAHNVLMELWLNIGLVGTAAYLSTLLIVFYRMENVPPENYLFLSAYMVIFCFHGLTERSLMPADYQTYFFFLSMGAASERNNHYLINDY